ncbi:hypothetical protein H4Q26_000387 [Puccinia striiformis f. sp. tritici PST-130]|nr:hypothetical protein H4Q26_000387 [Puccinia striiformis f. sp. tritici PST-130]
MENDISPVPMVKIEPQDEEFGFDGTNVNQFLDSYRKAAQATGASEDDMAQQLGFFVLRDDLLNIVETLNGYEPPDWPRLKASMIMYWGRDEIPRFTLEDFERLLLSWSEKDDISPARDYPVFCNSLQPIVSQFLGNNDMDTEEAQDIFYQAFSRVLQLSLHRSTSVSNETPIHPVIDYQAPTKNSPLLESPPTVFSDIIATPSVPESQEEEGNAEPEPSEQLIKDPKEAAVSLLPPMPSPIRGSLDQSEVCLENSVENDHLNASDSGLYDFRYLQLPDISAFELLKMEPLVKEEKTTLVSLHQVEKNWEDSTVSFGHLVNAVEHNPVPSAPTTLQIDSLPEGLGEDHNYFIDRFYPSDHIFHTEPSIFDMTSTPDQVTGVFSDSHLSSPQNSDSEKGLHITRISNMISLPLSHRTFQSNLILSSGEPLRYKDQLPSFAFEEQDTSFSNNSAVFKCENNQDPLFQDPLQVSLRDEDKLSLFQWKNTEGSTCEEKMLYLLRWKEYKDSFQEPVSPLQDQLRNEDKLYENLVVWKRRSGVIGEQNQLPALSLDGKEDTFQESPHSKNCKLLFSIAHLVSEGVDARQHSFSCILLLTQDQILQEQLLIIEDIEAILNFLDLIPSDVSRDHILAFLSLDKDASDSPSFLAPSGEADLVFLDSLAPVDGPFSVIGSLQIMSRSLSLWEAERLEVSPLLSAHLRVDTSQFVKTLLYATLVSHTLSSLAFSSPASGLSTIVNHQIKIIRSSFHLKEVIKSFQELDSTKEISAPQIPLASSFEFHQSFTPLGPALARARRDTDPVPPDRSTGDSSLAAVSLVQTISLSNPFDVPPNIRFLASISDDLANDCHSSLPIVFEHEVVDKLNIDFTSSHQATHYYLICAFSLTPNCDKSCCNIIKILKMISNALNLITVNCSFLFSYQFNSGASLLHFSSSGKDSHGLAWKRVGVGSSRIHLPATILRNEDKLQSFQLENLAFISYTGFNSTSVKLKENLVSWKISAAPLLASRFCWIKLERFFSRGGTFDQK